MHLFSARNFYYIIFITVSAGFILAGCSGSRGPVNLTRAKRDVSFYYESGQYQQEVKEILSKATVELNKLRLYDSSVVIFDVDETALSNYEHIKSLDFGYISEDWDKYILSARAKGIDEVKDFYTWLKRKGIRTIFLTGRSRRHYDATYKNLVREGYTDFDTLIVRPDSSTAPAAVFKSVERLVLANMGYRIIASVGDQESDFATDNTGMKILLPDYLYLVD
ncbi:MAG: HAD family acid phosphatase [Syntrophothermus sp.]